jgi:hypothetical protein
LAAVAALSLGATAQDKTAAELRAEKREAYKSEQEAKKAERQAAAANKRIAREEAAAERKEKMAADRASRGEENEAQRAAAKAETSRVKAADDANSAAQAHSQKDQGITSPLHEKNVGKIVFTRSDTSLEALTEATFVNAFTLGERIYFRVYMKESGVRALRPLVDATVSANLIGNGARYAWRFSVDGKFIDPEVARWGTIGDWTKFTTWRGQFLAEQANLPGTAAFREVLARAYSKGWLKPGNHQIKVEVAPRLPMGDGKLEVLGPVVARGEFSLDVNPKSLRRENDLVCPIKPSAMKDATLERSVLDLAKRTWNASGHSPVSAQILNDQWQILRHPVSGIVTRRSIAAQILSKGAEFCTVQGYQYAQNHDGSGFRGGEFHGAESKHTYLPCSCLE